MTVVHLKRMKYQQKTVDPQSLLSQYGVGFKECADEIGRYLDSVGILDVDVKTRLNNHLASCVRKIDQSMTTVDVNLTLEGLPSLRTSIFHPSKLFLVDDMLAINSLTASLTNAGSDVCLHNGSDVNNRSDVFDTSETNTRNYVMINRNDLIDRNDCWPTGSDKMMIDQYKVRLHSLPTNLSVPNNNFNTSPVKISSIFIKDPQNSPKFSEILPRFSKFPEVSRDFTKFSKIFPDHSMLMGEYKVFEENENNIIDQLTEKVQLTSEIEDRLRSGTYSVICRCTISNRIKDLSRETKTNQTNLTNTSVGSITDSVWRPW